MYSTFLRKITTCNRQHRELNTRPTTRPNCPAMYDSINGSDYGILNWHTPTRVSPNAEPSSTDVSLASASLISSCSWQTLSSLSSYHLPIIIRLQMKTTQVGRKQQQRPRSTSNLCQPKEGKLGQIQTSSRNRPEKAFPSNRPQKIFRTVLLKVASHHIPTG